MATFFSELWSYLRTMIILLITIILLRLVLVFQWVNETISNYYKPGINNTTQYLQLIEEKNPTTRFTRKMMIRQQSTECPVCLSSLVEGHSVRRLKCNHVFHKDCLDKWLQRCWATCPLCRTEVLPDQIVASYKQMLVNDRIYENELIWYMTPI